MHYLFLNKQPAGLFLLLAPMAGHPVLHLDTAWLPVSVMEKLCSGIFLPAPKGCQDWARPVPASSCPQTAAGFRCDLLPAAAWDTQLSVLLWLFSTLGVCMSQGSETPQSPHKGPVPRCPGAKLSIDTWATASVLCGVTIPWAPTGVPSKLIWPPGSKVHGGEG